MAKRDRNYAREYEQYHGKPEQIAARSSRNKARRAEEKAGRVRKGDGKEVDHINSQPLDNRPSNRQILTRHQNRVKGDRAGKRRS